jgi:hypothetical protein
MLSDMKDKESSIEKIELLPEHESGVRRLISDARDIPYYPLHSLAEAKSFSDGVVILEGDDGGQIYMVCPAALVKCSIETLERLLRDLDHISWPGNDLNSARVFYERLPIGAPVFGGMGGATVEEDVWIFQGFVDSGLEGPIREVIGGRCSGIGDAA